MKEAGLIDRWRSIWWRSPTACTPPSADPAQAMQLQPSVASSFSCWVWLDSPSLYSGLKFALSIKTEVFTFLVQNNRRKHSRFYKLIFNRNCIGRMGDVAKHGKMCSLRVSSIIGETPRLSTGNLPILFGIYTFCEWFPINYRRLSQRTLLMNWPGAAAFRSVYTTNFISLNRCIQLNIFIVLYSTCSLLPLY